MVGRPYEYGPEILPGESRVEGSAAVVGGDPGLVFALADEGCPGIVCSVINVLCNKAGGLDDQSCAVGEDVSYSREVDVSVPIKRDHRVAGQVVRAKG